MQDKAALLTTLADTIKAEKEQLGKRTADEIEALKKDVAAKETGVTVANAKFEKVLFLRINILIIISFIPVQEPLVRFQLEHKFDLCSIQRILLMLCSNLFVI